MEPLIQRLQGVALGRGERGRKRRSGNQSSCLPLLLLCLCCSLDPFPLFSHFHCLSLFHHIVRSHPSCFSLSALSPRIIISLCSLFALSLTTAVSIILLALSHLPGVLFLFTSRYLNHSCASCCLSPLPHFMLSAFDIYGGLDEKLCDFAMNFLILGLSTPIT